ncbi:MAG: FHA domain-containing protein [Polyangiales bacterium]
MAYNQYEAGVTATEPSPCLRMDAYLGIACGQCAHLNDIAAMRCSRCYAALDWQTDHAEAAPESPPANDPPVSAHTQTPTTQRGNDDEDMMEQARSYVCKQCSTPVPLGHRFCGACGAAVPESVLQMSTDYFGSMQTPGRARLLLVRGSEGAEGLSYMLQGAEHIVGRHEAQIQFPDDLWLSPKHANFCYRNEELVVVDNDSVNGVFWRLPQPATLNFNDEFLCGEQLFRLEAAAQEVTTAAPDGTQYYCSPRTDNSFRIVQLLCGGRRGMELCSASGRVRIGRYDNDMNFPDDVFMSGHHATIEAGADGSIQLRDEGSKNGTYVRVHQEQKLQHGDYVFIGHQLLRVEVTA